MKPRNFPGRRERRKAQAFARTHGYYPAFYMQQPTDIRIRRGAAARLNDT